MRLPSLTVLLALTACGDSGNTSVGTETGTTQAPPATSTEDPTTTPTGTVPTTGTPGTTTDTGGSATEAMTGTTAAPVTTGAVDPTTSTGTSTGDPSTGGVLDTTTTGDSSTSTGSMETGVDTECGGGDIQFSFIWIANSPEGTVSKIDTETLIEVARYRTGQPGADPSRTSVNLKGDVAITNRDGSITKIGAIEDQCKEKNGQPGIQTSTGPNDVLAWGADECVLWNTALMPASRPAAWTSGDLIDPDNPCSGFTGEKVWTSAPTGNDAIVYILDGETGVMVLGPPMCQRVVPAGSTMKMLAVVKAGKGMRSNMR